MDDPKVTQQLAEIARLHLRIATLEVRGRDALDFHSVSVLSVVDALRAAYEAGKKDEQQQKTRL
jgi:hypothetical protein